MPPVILAAVAAIGAELVVAELALSGWTAIATKFAFSAAVSLVGQSLSRADTPQAPMAVEAQSRKQLVRASADPRRVVYGKVQVSGTLLYASNGTDKNYVHLVIALAGHSCHHVGDIWLGDEMLGALDAGGECTAGRFAGFVRVRKHLGSPTQAADADLNAECPEWGAKNRPLKGIAYVYLRIKRSRDVFPNGLPTPRFELWGKNDILDPRTGLRGWQDNAALVSLDYILSPLGFNSPLDEVVQSSWIAAANVCDELVNLPAGGTQKRYTANGSFTLDSVPVEVLDEMRCAMAGCASYSMGLWEGHAGAASAPVLDLSVNDLRGSYKVRPRPSRARLYNAVKGTYISATDRWTETDFPPVTNPLYEGQDGGERIYKDVKLPFTTDPYAAQRIAKSDLERHRQGIVVEFPARIVGLKAKVWDVVRLSIAQQGWVQKQFRVVDKKISLFGGADLVLEEYSPAVYTWSTLDATTVDPAPDTSLPDPYRLDAPAGLALSSGTGELLILGDGTVISRLKLSWAAPADPSVRQAQVQYKKTADAVWQDSAPAPGGSGPVWLSPVEDGVSYEARVGFENGIGVKSAWTQAYPHVVIGKTEPPPDVGTFLVSAQADGTRQFSWSLAGTPPDLAGFLIRYKPGAGAVWADMTPLHDNLLVSSPHETNQLAKGEYTFAIKAVDTSGNESVSAAYVGLSIPDPRLAGTLDFIDEYASGWTGVKTGCHVEAETGTLKADDQTAWADLTTWADWPRWCGVPVATLVYERAVDVRAVARFTPIVSVIADGEPTVAEQHSDDGQAWTPWAATGSPVTARYIKIGITLTGAYPILKSVVTHLEAKPVDEEINDLDTSALTGARRIGVGDIRLPIAKSYSRIKRVQVQLINVGAGWSWALADKDTTLGPRIKIYNNGVPADATIDASIGGN